MHLQRLPGGKNAPLAIVCTGLFPEDFIKVFEQLASADRAARHVKEAQRAKRFRLQQEMQCANGRLRQARALYHDVLAGRRQVQELLPYELQLINSLCDDSLLVAANAIGEEHGDGTDNNEFRTFTKIGPSKTGQHTYTVLELSGS